MLAGALTARKRIAWWVLNLNLLIAAGLNVAGLTADHVSPARAFGETLGLGLHLAALVLLMLSYREFWAKVRQGALFKAAGVLLAGWASASGCPGFWSRCSRAHWPSTTGCSM